MEKIKTVIGREIYRTRIMTRSLDRFTEDEKIKAINYLKNYISKYDEQDRIDALIAYLETGEIIEEVNSIDIPYNSVILIDWENQKDNRFYINYLSKFCTVVAYIHHHESKIHSMDVCGLFKVVTVNADVPQAVDMRIYADIVKLKAKGAKNIVIVSGDKGYRDFCLASGIDCTLVTSARYLKVISPKIKDFTNVLSCPAKDLMSIEVNDVRMFDLLDSTDYSEDYDIVSSSYNTLVQEYSQYKSKVSEEILDMHKSLDCVEALLSTTNKQAFDKAMIELEEDSIIKRLLAKQAMLIAFEQNKIIEEAFPELEHEEVDLSRLADGIGSLADEQVQDYSEFDYLDFPEEFGYTPKSFDSDYEKDYIIENIELAKRLPDNVSESVILFARRLCKLGIKHLRDMCKEVGISYSNTDDLYDLALMLNKNPVKADNKYYRLAGLVEPHK